MQRGLRLNRKPKPAPEPREVDLSTTSRAKLALERSRKHSTPEEHEAISKKVAERYPDILQERR